jgi:putative lipoic acid-binding regulatory protein
MDNQKFKTLLDESYQWPDYYEFKFIIKTDDKSLILDKLPGFTIHETPSKMGNYTAVSARKLIKNTEEVLEIYELMSTIKGVISL